MRTAVLLIAFGAAFGGASMLGTWKMDPARQSFIGLTSPKSLTMRIEPHVIGEVFRLDRIETDGRSVSSSTILYFDSTPRDFQDFECLGAIVKVAETDNDGDPARLRSERLDIARAAITTKLQRTQSRDYRERS